MPVQFDEQTQQMTDWRKAANVQSIHDKYPVRECRMERMDDAYTVLRDKPWKLVRWEKLVD